MCGIVLFFNECDFVEAVMIFETSALILDEQEVESFICDGAYMISESLVIARAATFGPESKHISMTI